MNDIGHIRSPKAKAALITLVPDSFQLFKMIFDAAVIGVCLGVARDTERSVVTVLEFISA